eukprot:8326509-Pyramimonas_sp.AAC.2
MTKGALRFDVSALVACCVCGAPGAVRGVGKFGHPAGRGATAQQAGLDGPVRVAGAVRGP